MFRNSLLVILFTILYSCSSAQHLGTNHCVIPITEFGAKMDGKTDDFNAIQQSLDKLGYAYVPKSKLGARITKTIYLKSFQYLYGSGRGSIIKSNVSKGDFAICVKDIKFTEDAKIADITIQIQKEGSSGLNIVRSRNVMVDNIFISGNRKCDIGIQIDGGDENGSAWNQINKYTISRAKIGINLTSNTPKNFCNRNFIGYGIIQSSEIGVRLYRANTNTFFANTQGCSTGFLLDKSKFNRINTFIENSKINSMVLRNQSNNNEIFGALNQSSLENKSINNRFLLNGKSNTEFSLDE